VALLLSALACAGPTGSPSGTEDSLRAALATYDSAWLARDSRTVERILSPEYTYFTSNGGLNDKAATLESDDVAVTEIDPARRGRLETADHPQCGRLATA